MKTVAAIAVTALAVLGVSCKSSPSKTTSTSSSQGPKLSQPGKRGIRGSGGGGVGVSPGGSAGPRTWRDAGSDKVVRHQWSVLETTDVDGRITYGCFVPSGSRGTANLDMFSAKEGTCLAWYVHVSATKQYVRQCVYQLHELTSDGKKVVATHRVSDPPGIGADGDDGRWTAGELFVIDRVPAGLRAEPLPLAEFPLLLEWEVVEVMSVGDESSWLPAGNGRVVLNGSAVVKEDRPIPPPGTLAAPSLKIELCGADLAKLRDRLEERSAVEFDLLLRVGPAAGAVSPPGFQPDPPIQFEARLPITRSRIDQCLPPGN